MGLFGKNPVPLDPDFEAALRKPARFIQKMISKSQGVIRANLESGEELRLIVPDDVVSEFTFVVTSRRLLVFKNSVGSGVSRELTYVVRVTDRYHLTVDEVAGGRYYIRLEGPDFTVSMETTSQASAAELAQAVEGMR